jgi:hypothetical protein
MTTERLMESLDGARLVRYREPWLLVWHGGHGVHVYDPTSGAEIDYFSVGDFAQNDATIEEVEAGITEYLREAEDEDV